MARSSTDREREQLDAARRELQHGSNDAPPSGTHPAHAPHFDSVAPEVLPGYKIIRELGRGGMGVVYLARDTKLDRPVAIKTLPPGYARSTELMSRLQREARLLASLSHPNIAVVHALTEHEQARFLVMEYVEGETLSA